MALIPNLLRRKGLARVSSQAELAPDQPFVAIGDIHGRDDLLVQLFEKLAEKAAGLPLVFVGDYVDRGPESAKVLTRLTALSENHAGGVTCLMGNHEVMLLEFLDHPDSASRQWLKNGGSATLESFGIQIPGTGNTLEAPNEIRDQLIDAIGAQTVTWLRSRPLVWQSGNVAVTHAGADPKRPIEPRRGHGLLWGHPDFLKTARSDDLWIVHGHFIVDEPTVTNGRISIDTGAFKSNRLTAAIIEPGKVTFLTT